MKSNSPLPSIPFAPARTALLIGLASAVAAATAAPAQHADDGPLQFRGEPIVLGHDAAMVGQLVPDLELVTLDGVATRLSTLAGPRGLVIAMRDPGCPLSKKYAPRLAQLERTLGAEGFGFLYVNPMPYSTAAEARQEIDWYGFEGAYAVDPEGRVAAALAATTSTEVFLLDAARTLRYRGAIDDQYGLGYTKPEPTRSFLTSAVAAVHDARLPSVGATLAPGCYLAVDQEAVAASETAPPTWHAEVSRILQGRCQRCHHEGGVAPFPLVQYTDAVRRAPMIEWVLADGLMPPWFVGGGHDDWANDPTLTEAEMATVTEWLAGGMPEGDPADAPLPLTWVEGWTIGEPDAEFAIPEPFTVPAEGVVEYQYQYIKTDFAEDRWVRGLEVLPGARDVVHHVLVFIEDPELRRRAREGDREARRQVQGGAHTFFASFAPGQEGLRFPEGFGKWLPAGAWLKVQLHYTPNGREVVDATRIGFHFGNRPGTEVNTTSAVNFRFKIPPGDPRHEVVAEYEFPQDGSILALFPHTHLRGVAFRFELLDAQGEPDLLLDLPRYDFNWQLHYQLREPLDVSAGTVMRATAWYDNSADNPANPDPTIEVEWGDQTFEEMMIGYVNWVPRGPAPTAESAERR